MVLSGAVAGDRIARPEVSAKAQAVLDRGALLVYAGPGFGKTSLLTEVAGTEKAVAWVSCTAAEREPGALLASLIRALRGPAPEVVAAFEERLATAPPGQVEPAAAVRALLAELGELQPGRLLLILDDAEHLDGAGGALEIVGDLLRLAPPALHVAIAGRRRLDLRVAKLQTSGDVGEIGPEVLAFRPDECAAVLRLARSSDPSHEEIQRILEATDGWPLGVGLLAHAERGTDPAVLASSAQINGYLEEEVLAKLDDDLRRGVLHVSAARSLAPNVIEALGLGDEFIERVEAAGLVTPLPDRGQPRLHPLLHEALASRLESELPAAEVRDVHVRLAAALAEEDSAEAIDHWLAGEAWEQAAGAIAMRPDLIVASPARVRAWIDRMPDATLETPPILVLRAQLSRAAGEHENTVELMRRAVDAFGDAQDLGSWMARFELAMAMFLLGQFEPATHLAEGFDSPGAAAAGPAPPGVAQASALSLAALGRLSESDELALPTTAGPAAPLMAPLEALRRCHVDIPRGELDELEGQLAGAYAGTEVADPLLMRAYVLAGWAMFDDERGDTEASLERWAQSAEVSAGRLAVHVVDSAHCWRAILFTELGARDEAERELALVRGPEAGWRGYVFEAARAAVSGIGGDLDATRRAADAAWEVIAPGAIQFRVIAALQLIRALMNGGDAARARELADEVLDECDGKLVGADGRFYRSRLLALRAWIRNAGGDPGGVDDIAASVADGRAEWRFVLRKDWDRLEAVIWDALAEGSLEPAATVAAIARAAPPAGPLAALTTHPSGAVRAAALAPAIAEGDPAGVRRIAEMADDPDEDVAAAATAALRRPGRVIPPLRIELLGGFRVGRGRWIADDSDWGRAAASKLVRFLAVQGRVAVSEDVIFEALWPQLERDGASRSLRVAASLARKVLEAPGAPGGIDVSAGSYSLELGPGDSLDYELFENAAAAALVADEAESVALLERARSLWGGEPLPGDRFEDWTIAWRGRLTDRYAAVLGRLANALGAAGAHNQQLAIARELVEIDPVDEAAHRLLMVAYARTGRRGQALRQYLACRRALVEELGVEPSRATADLHARLLAGDDISVTSAS